MENKKIYTKEEALAEQDFLVSEMSKGKIFIYPTDTVYGLGANALLEQSAEKIKRIKKRECKNFLVIFPSLDWIFELCKTTEKTGKIIEERLPGPSSFILDLKDGKFFGTEMKNIGVRVPDHWFFSFIEKSGVPFITTSVNFSGQPPLLRIDDLDPDIAEKADYIICDDDSLSGRASTLVDLTTGEEKIIRP